MSPARYSELFFLDEAVATAAGHRPCACCRRTDYQQFLAGWAAAHASDAGWTSSTIDAVLHEERCDTDGMRRRLHPAPLLSVLPDGAFVALPRLPARAPPALVADPLALLAGAEREGERESSSSAASTDKEQQLDAWLVWHGFLLRWTHDGYAERRAFSEAEDSGLQLLTPPGLVAVLASGHLRPTVHRSAHDLVAHAAAVD